MFNWVIFYFSCQALENTFLGVSPHSLHWMTCFGGDWFYRGVSTFIFHTFSFIYLQNKNFRFILWLWKITTENA